MQKFIELVKGYFSITEKEARGFIVLSLIMLLVVFVPFAIKFIPDSQPDIEPPIAINLSEKTDTTTHIKPLPFDPNLIGNIEWQKMGINASLSRRIEKYKAAGGKFKIKSDLKKIYGFPEDTYLALHQFILLPDSFVHNHQHKIVKSSKKEIKATEQVKSFDINTADETQLEAIRGIGPVYSKRILKYRKLLGGFVNTQQLTEVYGLDSTVVKQVSKHIFIAESFKPVLIAVPEAGLPYHPYLSKEQAKALSQLIKNKQQVSSETLLKSGKFTENELQRILPYLPAD